MQPYATLSLTSMVVDYLESAGLNMTDSAR